LSDHVRGQIAIFVQEVHERWQRYSDKETELKETELATTGDDTKILRQRIRWRDMRNRYMQQFLVDQLSQRSLIPTYSFPVHSLALEVTRDDGQQGFWGQGGDILLSRDAILGISEYAPRRGSCCQRSYLDQRRAGLLPAHVHAHRVVRSLY
jgi:hypothetical protein